MKQFLFILSVIILTSCATTRNASTADTTASITALMNTSAEDWNRGDLDAFMTIYDTAATFMTSRGPIGLAGTKENYQRSFFKGDKPIQNLRFEDMVVRPMGRDYALLTGKFVLYGNDLADRRGVYSIVFVRRANGWKMLHDHSS